MLLHLQAWPDVERYLARSQGIIIPIGSTEQHGPNGLIGTDAICAEALAKAVGEKVEGWWRPPSPLAWPSTIWVFPVP